MSHIEIDINYNKESNRYEAQIAAKLPSRDKDLAEQIQTYAEEAGALFKSMSQRQLAELAERE